MSQKKLISQLRDLARDPDHSAALVSNAECLTSLRQTLDALDIDVVLLTLDCFSILAQIPSNRPILSGVDGLLKSIYMLQDNPNMKVASVAQNILDLLEPSQSDAEPTSADECQSAHSYQSKGSYGTNASRYVPRQLHITTLRVLNVTSAMQKENLINTAVAFQGIVSVTMDSQYKRATFYSTMPGIKHDLIKMMSKRGFQIEDEDKRAPRGNRKSGRRRDYTHHLGASDLSSNSSYPESRDEKDSGPSYLDPKTYKTGGAFNSRQLGVHNSNKVKVETLAERVQRIKQERRDSEKEETYTEKFFTSVKGFFWG